MARDYTPVPWEYLEEMEELGDSEFGRLIRALLKYSRTGEPIVLTGNERFYARRVMMREDRYRDAFEKIDRRNAENGTNGGRPKGGKSHSDHGRDKPTETQANPDKPTETQANPDKPTETQANPDKPTETQKTNTETDTETDTNLRGISPSSPPRGTRERRTQFVPPFADMPGVQTAWDEWLTYKQQRKDKPYTPIGEKKLLSQIRNAVMQYGEGAVADVISRSIAAGYQGIVWDWLGKQPTGGGSMPQGRRKTASELEAELLRGEFS